MAPTVLNILTSVSLLFFAIGAEARISHKFHRGIINRHIHHARAPPAVPTSLPGNWSSKGCYTDSAAMRTLPDKTYMDGTGMTVESCISFCTGNNFAYAGVEYSQECFCSNSIGRSSTNQPLSDCNMACSGNAAESCGGPNRLNVFWSGAAQSNGPTSPAQVGLWSSLGCYSDNGGARTLPVGTGTNGKVTVESCTTACQAGGFLLAGVEYSQECYCANEFYNGGAPANDGCTMLCAGNSSEYCGGPNRLNVYAFNGSFSAPTSSATTTTSSSTSSGGQSTPASSTSGSATSTPTGPVAVEAVGQWSSLGCYTDDVANRTLATRMGTNGPVTIDSCTSACEAAGFVVAGTEYTSECYCANAIGSAGTPASSGCTMTCEGNNLQFCGGPNRLSMYTFKNAVNPTSTTTSANPSPSTWSALGCYNDSTVSRVLQNGPMPIEGQLTTAKCQTACTAGSFVLAGVEYGQECYCDNAFRNGGASANDGCTMPCAGDATEMCGGSYRLNVFQFGTAGSTTTSNSGSSTSTSNSGTSGTTGGGTTDGTSTTGSNSGTSTTNGGSTSTSTTGGNPTPTETGWKTLGCYIDDVNKRTLTHAMNVNGANSIDACTKACYNAGYAYAGMEYSNECYCDSQLQNGGGPAPDGDAQCNMPCSGKADEICGGPNRLNILNYEGTLPTPPPDNGGNNGNNGNNGGGGGTVAPVTSGLPGTWSYNGCYIDGANGRILTAQQPDNQVLTAQACISTCSDQGYGIAAMEFMYQCFCGNQLINGAAKATSDSDCSMGCRGNDTQACGGANRMSVYSNTTQVNILPVPKPQTTGLPGKWQYVGCLAEPGAPRIFPHKLIFKTDNSATTCLSQCSKFGYPAAGMEYGEECWCGDVSDIAKMGGTNATETDCSMPCSGDPTYLCGAGNRLSYYQWTGEPLQTWHTPEHKGEYKFLIGGVVIPLITTLGVNNKVTFVEKQGTGPPNSTGAYELDLSQIDNFQMAWRTMHVKTDVFCSAGITLPDKVGRQLNVGGWSADSLFGVRLYWPDGSAGVPGTHDWQENVDELKLQRGRWYPTTMTMANGSILVVGGEDGSNGKPEPTLEILPTPAGGATYLQMDWLLRTDPNNLYPFLYVLPGGGIFVIYHNEARILNEVTFETTKTFPNLPGAVDDNTGAGRTYPLEGTSVMLPQHAPYTDPVTVLTCGGSTIGPGNALDNCVSIQPEAEGAQWVIERMPSKRVMTCMTTLPDGTFMIMNGAHQGVAGFGLANDPNFEAVMYDPYQPVGSRFSIMANTTVARMYHSEAILLQDGRVLVSGSDPEDPVHPQEYRVEVFIPPYLQDNKKQPELHIQNTDWAYGASVQFTATLFQGGANDVKVSLLAAVSSTHGNSMNQRILFPEVHCSGTGTVSCTVTAPPNAHVCPAGWFQMFVLDGPTPSWSTWVRIGGDPAGLGNWPSGNDFLRPGI